MWKEINSESLDRCKGGVVLSRVLRILALKVDLTPHPASPYTRISREIYFLRHKIEKGPRSESGLPPAHEVRKWPFLGAVIFYLLRKLSLFVCVFWGIFWSLFKDKSSLSGVLCALCQSCQQILAIRFANHDDLFFGRLWTHMQLHTNVVKNVSFSSHSKITPPKKIYLFDISIIAGLIFNVSMKLVVKLSARWVRFLKSK